MKPPPTTTMYNSNVSMNAPSPLLGIIGPNTMCTTPRTPEILNSVIAMTNPIEFYQQQVQNHHHQLESFSLLTTDEASQGQQYMSKAQLPQVLTTEPSAGSNSDSSAAVTPTGNEGTTPSVTKTRSLLIKYGLKLTIESKRKQSVGDSSGNETSKSNRKDTVNSMDSSEDDDDEDDDDEDQKSPKNGLTPEDEERRRRRRERNKIAATKCRMKKRQRTLNLVQESEILERQNIDLKDMEQKLERERRELLEALNQHRKACVIPGGYQSLSLPAKHSDSGMATIKTETLPTPTSGRGRRGGRGGRSGGRKQVKHEPIHSPLQPEKSVLPNNIMPCIQLPHFPTTQRSNNNNSGDSSDPFCAKYSAIDESSIADYYNYDAPLSSADGILVTPPVHLNNTSRTHNGDGGSCGGIGLHLRPSPLVKNDIYIPNCENSNDLLQCSPVALGSHTIQPTDLYMDHDTETKLHEMTINENINNLSCYDDTPLFSVFC